MEAIVTTTKAGDKTENKGKKILEVMIKGENIVGESEDGRGLILNLAEARILYSQLPTLMAELRKIVHRRKKREEQV